MGKMVTSSAKLTLMFGIVVATTTVVAYKNPQYASRRERNQDDLLLWKKGIISDECESLLRSIGFGRYQVSSLIEIVIMSTHSRSWWERHQPKSYELVMRYVEILHLAIMLRRCYREDVRFFSKAVINHMTKKPSENVGTAGNTAEFSNWYYPGVPFLKGHFKQSFIGRANNVFNASRDKSCSVDDWFCRYLSSVAFRNVADINQITIYKEQNDYWDLSQAPQTNLLAGSYYGLTSDNKVNGSVQSKMVTVGDVGGANIGIEGNDYDMMLVMDEVPESLRILLSSPGMAATTVNTYKNPNYVSGRSVIVHLFEWKWDDIADECERFLGPMGFGGVQISPPNENVILWTYNRPWWERYQPISYELVTRSGNEQQFANMLRRCNAAGVRIYVDAVINHMTNEPPENVGTAGNTAVFSDWYYPGVPFTREHFNSPHCIIGSTDNANNASRIRNCELLGLKDLNQANEHVREKILSFMNKLIDFGVAGFRIDAAKHMWPEDLRIIYDSLHDLNTDHGFPSNARPYIYQEIVDYGGEAITRDEYTPIGAVTEFKVGLELSNAFRGGNQIKWLFTWGPQWDLLAHEDALTFIDNHDNERHHCGGGATLTYKEPKPYKAAIAFLLAHPYGEPQIMSSFEFWDSEIGPPMDPDGNIISPSINPDDTCGNGWVCQHRWRQIYVMVAFRNVAANTPLTNWWDNGSNQIAFCRGNKAFIAFNNDLWDLNQTLQTCLPAGSYCDVISGNKANGSCQGKTVTVDNDGQANIYIGTNDYDLMLAIHVGSESRL